MKNQCQHTGQNAAFKLLFSRTPIRGFWQKPSILEERFENHRFWKKDLKTIDFGKDKFPPGKRKNQKMRFSIQQVPSEKMFFHTIPPAERATGLHRSTIQGVLNSGAYVYHRKKDNQIFHIRKEDPILIAEINGEKFFSLEEIGKKFEISPTKFMNQIQNKKFPGKINWLSDELFPEREAKRVQEAKMGGKDLIAEIQERITRLAMRVERLEESQK